MKKSFFNIKKLRFLVSALVAGTVALSAGSAYAASVVQYGSYVISGKTQKVAHADVRIDSVKVVSEKGDVPPLILKSRTLVPVKLVSEKVGATVSWNAKTEEVTMARGDKSIVLKIGSPTASVNGLEKNLPDNVAPIIVSQRTMLPLKFLADEFALSVNYDPADNVVNMVSTGVFQPETGTTFDPNAGIDLTGVTVVNPEETTTGETTTPPVNPPVTTPVNPPVTTPPASIGQKEISYLLNQISLDQEEFAISGKDLSYDSFYLSSPERLVLDIKNAQIQPDLEQNKMYSFSGFITQMNSFYHTEENKLRITLTLAKDVKRTDVSIQKNEGGLYVNYKSSKPLNSNVAYSSDRITGTFDLRFNGGYGISDVNTSVFDNAIEFTVPVSVSGLRNENRTPNDNLVSKIEIKTSGDTATVKLFLKERVEYQIADSGTTGKFTLKLNKEQRSRPLIIVDAGHGAKDPGAVSSGKTEKELNLIISQKLASALQSNGFEVITTRDTDVFVELKERAAVANRNEADIFVSIHHNATGNTSANGIETLYYPSEDNKVLAQMIHREMVNASGANDRRIITRGDLVVLNSTKVPAVLLELGYMTNPSELAKVSEDSYQNRMVQGIVNGINAYIMQY